MYPPPHQDSFLNTKLEQIFKCSVHKNVKVITVALNKRNTPSLTKKKPYWTKKLILEGS